MLAFTPIPVSEIKELIRFTWMADQPLMKYFHVSPGSLDHCTEHTFHAVTENAGDSVIYAKIQYREKETDEYETAGFIVYGTSPFNILFSFGLNIKYRKGVIKKEFIEQLKSIFVSSGYLQFLITLYNKNSRAISFFEKHGFKSFYNKDQTTTLCHLQ